MGGKRLIIKGPPDAYVREQCCQLCLRAAFLGKARTHSEQVTNVSPNQCLAPLHHDLDVLCSFKLFVLCMEVQMYIYVETCAYWTLRCD